MVKMTLLHLEAQKTILFIPALIYLYFSLLGTYKNSKYLQYAYKLNILIHCVYIGNSKMKCKKKQKKKQILPDYYMFHLLKSLHQTHKGLSIKS